MVIITSNKQLSRRREIHLAAGVGESEIIKMPSLKIFYVNKRLRGEGHTADELYKALQIGKKLFLRCQSFNDLC